MKCVYQDKNVCMRYGFDLAPVSSIRNCSDGVVVFVVHFIIANIYFDSDMSKSTNTVICFNWFNRYKMLTL
jgi:hypothetical protein